MAASEFALSEMDAQSVRIYDTTTRLHKRDSDGGHTGGYCRACANNYTAISAFLCTPEPIVETVVGTDRECPKLGHPHERHHYRYRYTRPGETDQTEGYSLCSGWEES